jgi:hypothetical protein
MLCQVHIYLGDIHRYKVQHLEDPKIPGAFQEAKQHYLTAADLRPDYGSAHNSLAVVAAFSRDYLECFYRSVLSLLVRRPYSNDSAKQNLRTLIDATRQVTQLSFTLQDKFVAEVCFALGAIYLGNTMEAEKLHSVAASWKALVMEDPLGMQPLGTLPCRVVTVCVFVAEAAPSPQCRAQALLLLTSALTSLFDGLTTSIERGSNNEDALDTLVLVDHAHGAANLGLLWVSQNLPQVIAASPSCRDAMQRLYLRLLALENIVPTSDRPIHIMCLPEHNEVTVSRIAAWANPPPELQQQGCEVTSEEEAALLRRRVSLVILGSMKDCFGYIPDSGLTTAGPESLAHLAEPEPGEGDDDDDDDIIVSTAFTTATTPVVFESQDCLSTFAAAWGNSTP